MLSKQNQRTAKAWNSNRAKWPASDITDGSSVYCVLKGEGGWIRGRWGHHHGRDQWSCWKLPEEDCNNWMRLTKNVEDATPYEKVMVDDGSCNVSERAMGQHP